MERREMTEFSARMFDLARNYELSVKDAVKLLKEQAVIRTLGDKLVKFAKDKDVRQTLTEGLMANDPQLKKDAAQRKVRDWLNNAERTIDKKTAIELCFILGLSLEEADSFLAMVSEEGFHWRDPEDMVYAFAILHKMSYPEAKKLCGEIVSECKSGGESKESYTDLAREKVQTLETADELKAYVKEMSSKLGSYHNTAYSLFMKYLTVLEENDSEFTEFMFTENAKNVIKEDGMTDVEISDECLHAGVFRNLREKGKKAGQLSIIEKNLKASWPDNATLSHIKKRREDVTRKVLILLFLATDGAQDYSAELSYDVDADDDYILFDEEEEMTPEEVFEDTYSRLNDVLTLSGFAPIDPRSPFDWMVLYCMCVSEAWETDERMDKFLKEAYGLGDDLKN